METSSRLSRKKARIDQNPDREKRVSHRVSSFWGNLDQQGSGSSDEEDATIRQHRWVPTLSSDENDVFDDIQDPAQSPSSHDSNSFQDDASNLDSSSTSQLHSDISTPRDSDSSYPSLTSETGSLISTASSHSETSDSTDSSSDESAVGLNCGKNRIKRRVSSNVSESQNRIIVHRAQTVIYKAIGTPYSVENLNQMMIHPHADYLGYRRSGLGHLSIEYRACIKERRRMADILARLSEDNLLELASGLDDEKSLGVGLANDDWRAFCVDWTNEVRLRGVGTIASWRKLIDSKHVVREAMRARDAPVTHMSLLCDTLHAITAAGSRYWAQLHGTVTRPLASLIFSPPVRGTLVRNRPMKNSNRPARINDTLSSVPKDKVLLERLLATIRAVNKLSAHVCSYGTRRKGMIDVASSKKNAMVDTTTADKKRKASDMLSSDLDLDNAPVKRIRHSAADLKAKKRK